MLVAKEQGRRDYDLVACSVGDPAFVDVDDAPQASADVASADADLVAGAALSAAAVLGTGIAVFHIAGYHALV